MRAPALLLAPALCLACETAAAPPLLAEPPPPIPAFSAANVWTHLAALVEIGPRVSGSEGAARARAYIEEQLSALGLEPEPVATGATGEAPAPGTPADGEGPASAPTAELGSVLAEIPGASSDLILLLAPYDTRRFEHFDLVGANDGGSGAALLLELARVLVERPLPYTTWVVFLDGEAEISEGVALRGSRELARRVHLEGIRPRVRLVLAVNQVCDPDLRIARDLYSHRLYRNEFWAAAARLGHGEHFEQEHFESPRASHWPFINSGLQRVTALVDPTFGGEEPPGIYANSEDDDLEHCSEESLAVVGSVVLEGLGAITRRLVKIDRFSDAPLAGLEDEGAAPVAKPPLPGLEPPADAAAGGSPSAAPDAGT